MPEQEKKEFEMFSDLWNLRKKCLNTSSYITFSEVKSEAQSVIKQHKTPLCKDLVKVIMDDYCNNQKER